MTTKSLNVLFPKFMEVIHVANINMTQSHTAAAGQDGDMQVELYILSV